MPVLTLSVLGPSEIVEGLPDALAGHGWSVEEPEAADALSDAADSPLGPDEIQAGMQFVSVMLDTGKHALEFASALVVFCKSVGGAPKLSVVDNQTGKPVATVDASSDPEELADRLPK
jgi:hypothetical protein